MTRLIPTFRGLRQAEADECRVPCRAPAVSIHVWLTLRSGASARIGMIPTRNASPLPYPCTVRNSCALAMHVRRGCAKNAQAPLRRRYRCGVGTAAASVPLRHRCLPCSVAWRVICAAGHTPAGFRQRGGLICSGGACRTLRADLAGCPRGYPYHDLHTLAIGDQSRSL